MKKILTILILILYAFNVKGQEFKEHSPCSISVDNKCPYKGLFVIHGSFSDSNSVIIKAGGRSIYDLMGYNDAIRLSPYSRIQLWGNAADTNRIKVPREGLNIRKVVDDIVPSFGKTLDDIIPINNDAFFDYMVIRLNKDDITHLTLDLGGEL